MSMQYWIALAVCLTLIIFLFVLLRGRHLREKYAAIWIVLALATCVVGAFPQLVAWLAELLGVQTPSNLLFAVSLVVLLIVCIQLSAELTSNEEEVRTLTEEIALLQLQMQEVRQELKNRDEP